MKVSKKEYLYAELLVAGKEEDFVHCLTEDYCISSVYQIGDVVRVTQDPYVWNIKADHYVIMDYDWRVIDVVPVRHFDVKYRKGWS